MFRDPNWHVVQRFCAVYVLYCYADIDVTFPIWISFDHRRIKMESQYGH